MQIYIVRPGDSLYSIARHYGTSAKELGYINQLSDPSRLTVGQTIVVPTAVGALDKIEVNAYAYPNISRATLEETLPYLTFLCPFSWHMDAQGGITPIDDTEMISMAYSNKAAPMLTLTNIGSNGGFSSDIAHVIFTNMTVQNILVDNILFVLQQKGYYGVNFNIEYVYPFDREAYNAFLERMSNELHSRGYYLSSAIAPRVSDEQQGLLYTAHDYAAHGEFCDRVIIMTYEWGYTYSQPQAVSPVDSIRKVLDYAVTKIPSGKILLGFSNYGYDWTLPWKQGQAATVISNVGAANLASSSFSEIKFSDTAKAPYFNYTSPDKQRHEVWFEDARSVEARLKLVREYRLAGISYWTINQLNRPGLMTLGGMYSTEKII